MRIRRQHRIGVRPIQHLVGLVLLALALAGIAYTLAATMLLARLRPDLASADSPASQGEGIAILKPLHGDEPRLADNLMSFADQTHDGAIEIVAGVADASDSALPVARRLATRGAPIAIVVDPRRHGANAKVSNLINMIAHANQPIIILSDSDIAAPPGYLGAVLAALGEPGVGVVTCLYAGRGDAGFWSRLAAAGISWSFLPSVLIGTALGRAQPCMGSTIALRRETLDRIGGLERFADVLADDHAIGAAVRALGLRVAMPPLLVTHGCAEPSLGALFDHELRWAITVRGLDPAGHVGSIVTHPLPLAMLALLLGAPGGAAIAAAALLSRLLLAFFADARAGRRTLPLALLPIRDLIGFTVFIASLGARSVKWRGARQRVRRGVLS